MRNLSSIFLAVVMLLDVANSFAQEHQEEYSILSGKITDEENKTVFNAKIIISQGGVQKDIAWSHNMYKVRVYLSGIYEIEVFYLGCSIAKREIELKKGENRTLDIQVDLSNMRSQSISGKITNKKTDENLVGAVVAIQNDTAHTHTRTLEDGTYSIKEIPIGIYNVEVLCVDPSCMVGYMVENKKIEVKKDEKLKLDFQLRPVSEAHFHGKVTDEDTGEAITFALITLKQNGRMITNTHSDFGGYYYMEHIPAGIYEIVVTRTDYNMKRMEIEIKEGEKLNLDFQFKFVPQIEEGEHPAWIIRF